MKRSGSFCLSSEPCLPGTLSFDRAGLRRKLTIQLQSHASGFCYRPTGVVNNNGLARVYSGHKPSFDLLTKICLRQRTQSVKKKSKFQGGGDRVCSTAPFFLFCFVPGSNNNKKKFRIGYRKFGFDRKEGIFFSFLGTVRQFFEAIT